MYLYKGFNTKTIYIKQVELSLCLSLPLHAQYYFIAALRSQYHKYYTTPPPPPVGCQAFPLLITLDEGDILGKRVSRSTVYIYIYICIDIIR